MTPTRPSTIFGACFGVAALSGVLVLAATADSFSPDVVFNYRGIRSLALYGIVLLIEAPFLALLSARRRDARAWAAGLAGTIAGAAVVLIAIGGLLDLARDDVAGGVVNAVVGGLSLAALLALPVGVVFLIVGGLTRLWAAVRRA